MRPTRLASKRRRHSSRVNVVSSPMAEDAAGVSRVRARAESPARLPDHRLSSNAVTAPEGQQPPSQPAAGLPALAALDLQSLLAEVTDRVESVARLADRLQALLHAVVSTGSQLELPVVLRRVVETA